MVKTISHSGRGGYDQNNDINGKWRYDPSCTPTMEIRLRYAISCRQQFTVSRLTTTRDGRRGKDGLRQYTQHCHRFQFSTLQLNESSHNCKNTTNNSELFFQDASHTATCTAGLHPSTLLMQRTHLRRVRLPMVSRLSGASTGLGNINEQASNTTSTSNTVTMHFMQRTPDKRQLQWAEKRSAAQR